MTWATEIATLRQLVLDNWSTTEVAWPGEHFDPPARTGIRSAPASWVEVVVNHNPGEQLAFGSTGVRNYGGQVTLMLFVEPNVNDLLLRQYADTLSTYFRDTVTADRIWFGEPWFRWHGPDGEWIRADLNIPYRRLKSFGVTDAAELAGAVSDQETVTQASHGLAVKDWVDWDGASWSKAVADGVSSLTLIGVVSKVTDVDTFTVTTGGSVVLTAHGETLGPLYLSQTVAGTVSSSAPTTGYRKHVGDATTSNRITVTQKLTEDLGD